MTNITIADLHQQCDSVRLDTGATATERMRATLSLSLILLRRFKGRCEAPTRRW